MRGPDFDTLQAAGHFPDSSIPTLVEPALTEPASQAEVADAVERAISGSTDIGHVQEGLMHATELIDMTTSSSDLGRGFNQYGQPRTLPIPIPTPEQLEGGL